MINKLKTCFTVAVWFSIVTISNAFADGHMAAIKKWSNGEFSLSALSAKERFFKPFPKNSTNFPCS